MSASYTHVFDQIDAECQASSEIRTALVALSADTAASTRIGQLRQVLAADQPPDTGNRFLALPMVENAMLSIAEGLMLAGHFPVVGIYECLLRGALEEVQSTCRSYSAEEMGILIVATHAGISVPDGRGVQTVWEPAALGSMPGLRYIEPASADRARDWATETVRARRGFTVLRCPREPHCVRALPEGVVAFPTRDSDPSGAPLMARDVVVFCNGATVKQVIAATQNSTSSDSIGVAVIETPELGRSDRKALQTWALNAKHVLVVQDHVGWGLPELAWNVASQHPDVTVHKPTRYGFSGEYDDVADALGLSSAELTKALNRLLDDGSP